MIGQVSFSPRAYTIHTPQRFSNMITKYLKIQFIKFVIFLIAGDLKKFELFGEVYKVILTLDGSMVMTMFSSSKMECHCTPPYHWRVARSGVSIYQASIEWPSLSLNLTSIDFFLLMVFVKDKVFSCYSCSVPFIKH